MDKGIVDRDSGSQTSGDRPNRKSNQSGQSLVELALLMPVVMLLLLGTVDLSRALYAYITVIGAATAGAQYASSSIYASTDITGITEAVTREASSLSPAPTASVSAPQEDGVDDGMGEEYKKITVQVRYDSRLLFPWPMIPRLVPVQGSSTMRVVPRP